MGAWHKYNQLHMATVALSRGNLEAATRYLATYREAQ